LKRDAFNVSNASYLSHDIKILPFHDALANLGLNGFANVGLVAVNGGAIKVPVAFIDGDFHSIFHLAGIVLTSSHEINR
jgi:hypothetical protein